MAAWQIHIDGDVSPDTLDAGDLAIVLGSWSKVVAAVARQQEIPPELIGFSVQSVLPGSVAIPLDFRNINVPALVIDDIARWIKVRLPDIPHGIRGPVAALRELSARRKLTIRFGVVDGLTATVEPRDLAATGRVSGLTTIYGEVVRVGGDDPAVRIDTATGAVTCRNVSHELAQSAAQYLYREVRVTGYANWDADTLSIVDFRIDTLEPVDLKNPAGTFAELRTEFGSAFAGDSRAILHELRG